MYQENRLLDLTTRYKDGFRRDETVLSLMYINHELMLKKPQNRLME